MRLCVCQRKPGRLDNTAGLLHKQLEHQDEIRKFGTRVTNRNVNYALVYHMFSALSSDIQLLFTHYLGKLTVKLRTIPHAEHRQVERD